MSKQMAVRNDPTYAASVKSARKRSPTFTQGNEYQHEDGMSKRPRLDVPSFSHSKSSDKIREILKDREQDYDRFLSELQAKQNRATPASDLGGAIHPTSSRHSASISAAPSHGISTAVRLQHTSSHLDDHDKLIAGDARGSNVRSMPGLSLSASTAETSTAVPTPALTPAKAAADHRKGYEPLLSSPDPSRWSPMRPQYVDPMLQTSTRVRPAGRNLVGRATSDGLLESGVSVVLSEVEMLMLPFGGVIELANRYPEESRGTWRDAEEME